LTKKLTFCQIWLTFWQKNSPFVKFDSPFVKSTHLYFKLKFDIFDPLIFCVYSHLTLLWLHLTNQICQKVSFFVKRWVFLSKGELIWQKVSFFVKRWVFFVKRWVKFDKRWVFLTKGEFFWKNKKGSQARVSNFWVWFEKTHLETHRLDRWGGGGVFFSKKILVIM